MKIDLEEILSWDTKYRLKFINSISGYKAAHLIGTENKEGQTNLAIFNSIVHIGSHPPTVGFITRPLTVERSTYNNIIETGYYTINHVHKSFLNKAHFTSANFPSDVSEFEACNLTPEKLDNFSAPFVKESQIKFGLKLKEDLTIETNGTHLIIGEIQEIIINEDAIEEDGQLNLEVVNNVAVTGLNQYSTVINFRNLPYARVNEAPNFKVKERPDNVVFDNETQSYNANLLPYGTSAGAPVIVNQNLTTWVKRGVSKFNHSLSNKIDIIKEDYQKLIDEFDINEKIYSANISFEPIIGQTYHLYVNDKTDKEFLSMIPPNSWKKQFLGSFQLNHEGIWKRIEGTD